MDISREDAREIVSEISKLLGTKMNIMNKDAIIIASTDSSRINNFHKAAYEIIKNNLSGFEISNDDEMEGTLSGQNLPIYNDGKIIGVVGITGDSEQTRKYVSIVQKMTEILMQGKIREAENQRKHNTLNNYLFDWVFNEDESEKHRLTTKGLELGIDITLSRRIVIIDVDDNSEVVEKRIINYIKLQDKNNLIFRASNYIIAAIIESDEIFLKSLFDSILNKVENYSSVVHIACSGEYEPNIIIRRLYLQALKSYEVARSSEISNIILYSNLSIELVLNNLAYNVKKEIVDKIFSSLDDKSKREYLPILKAFYRANGSLKVASSYLNIHVNTIQYHLNKLKEKTGYDARNYNDSVLIQIAIKFLELNVR
jgi:carbohydrate diacid regulator